jgi:hypothetical protein
VFPRPALSRESIADAVADLLGNGVYTCQRQWSAWSYGTMGPDDFVPSSETELPMEIADAVAELLKAAPTPVTRGQEVSLNAAQLRHALDSSPLISSGTPSSTNPR